MICILKRGPLIGSLVQNLANLPKTMNLRSPASQGDLFQE
jgi:hypothetical protein